MMLVTGLVAAAYTPMDDKGEIVPQMIDELAHWYRQHGVVGAFICGTTGEGPLLTLQEKMEVMERWGKAKSANQVAIAMLGGNCLKDMQYLAQMAEDVGMDAIAVMSPYFYVPQSLQELVDLCASVASVTPDLPFYFYHIPSVTKGNYSMRSFLELAGSRIPSLAGIKFSHSDLMDFHRAKMYKDGQYNLLWGCDEILLSALCLGADGAVGSTYNYLAPLYHKIINSYKSGNMAEAEYYQGISVETVHILDKYGGLAAGKAFMKLIGLDCGWCRPPLGKYDQAQLDAMEKELQNIGFFEYCFV